MMIKLKRNKLALNFFRKISFGRYFLLKTGTDQSFMSF